MLPILLRYHCYVSRERKKGKSRLCQGSAACPCFFLPSTPTPTLGYHRLTHKYLPRSDVFCSKTAGTPYTVPKSVSWRRSWLNADYACSVRACCVCSLGRSLPLGARGCCLCLPYPSPVRMVCLACHRVRSCVILKVPVARGALRCPSTNC